MFAIMDDSQYRWFNDIEEDIGEIWPLLISISECNKKAVKDEHKHMMIQRLMLLGSTYQLARRFESALSSSVDISGCIDILFTSQTTDILELFGDNKS